LQRNKLGLSPVTSAPKATTLMKWAKGDLH
jgi:hypothetical protein